MNRIILAGFVMLTAALPLFAQEQPPVLDSGFGIKLFSLGEYEAMVNVEQSSDEGFYIDGNLNGLIRLDAAGNKLWGKPYAVDSSFTYTEDISLDSRNNIYAGMVNYRSGEVLVQKYDSDGNLVKSYVTPPGRHFMSGVVFNKDLNKLYAALNYYDGAAGKYVLAVKMFDENLNITASTIYSAPTTVWAEGGIGLDKAGNVYVSGTQMKTTSTPAKHIGLKYDADLNFIWESSVPFILQQGWTGSVAVFDGGMYLMCFEDGDTHDRLLNISSDGVKMWEKPVPEDYGYYKGVDKAGNFYGSRFDEENNWTPTISKLRYADGDTAWSVAEPQSYKIDDIYVDSQTRVYTVGELVEPVGDANYYIARYVQGEACGRLDVPYFSQLDPQWVNDHYNGVLFVGSIKNAGCTLTATSMVYNYYGKPHNISTNPGKLNTDLKNNNGYTPSYFPYTGGKIKWGVAACLSKSMVFDNVYSKDKGGDITDQAIRELIEAKLKRGDPVIIKAKSRFLVNHFKVVTGKCGDDWIVHDPKFGSDIRLSVNEEILGIRSFVPSTIYPAPCKPTLLSWLSSPAELLMTDPSDNRTGFEPVSKTVIRNIFDSSYFTDAIDNAETGEADSHPTKQLGISNPASGTYKLDVIGIAIGTYTLGVDAITENGAVKEVVFKGVTDSGIINSFELNYSGSPEQPVTAARAATFDSTRKDIELSLTFGLITNQGIANSLTQKLNNAEESKNKGNINAAQNILNALLNEIEAQTDKHISKDAVEFLKQDIQHLREHL